MLQPFIQFVLAHQILSNKSIEFNAELQAWGIQLLERITSMVPNASKHGGIRGNDEKRMHICKGIPLEILLASAANTPPWHGIFEHAPDKYTDFKCKATKERYEVKVVEPSNPEKSVLVNIFSPNGESFTKWNPADFVIVYNRQSRSTEMDWLGEFKRDYSPYSLRYIIRAKDQMIVWREDDELDYEAEIEKV